MEYVRHGRGAVRPYIYARLDTLNLIREAFGAKELECLGAPNGFHVEAAIGDSIIVVEAADPPVVGGTISSIYIYVPDVDQAFDRALASGATCVSEPEDKPYQERGAGVRDAYGNTWWVATYTGE
jgi:PhnB protein